ncbi:DUF637 domain-containing protein [Moraxella catarrhalis]|uniref:DUF637 domain-containing protein n=1 Tax=Moraxella catarrhalis TaxID=480 RepID=UPI000803B0F9|nr:DUF637 domain-containing protein [Moraxella catarrhalis]OBX40493.1 hypothetical protein A9Z59_03135 [Moraxella catarrhalis]RKL92527.1 hypothetical protein D6E02_08850 [Moraxella catarrhalis]RKL95870.1 hypothetical protein D6D96_08900 [Moraxella catarrhalis]
MDIQIPISQKEQKAGITLQEQIDIPIQQPEYSYLNQFIDREDTTWQEIVLAEDGWDYKQEGLTPAGAAIVGSQTVGAMAGAAFSSLTNLASVSLINNQGDVEAILKELGPKDNVKQLTLAITSAGISHKIDKSLGLKGIDITQTGFDQRLVKVIANSTSTSLLQTAVYGSDFEENLKKNLRMQFATVATQDTFSNIVKDLDGDTLSDNITHKLAAGLTGCLSAKAAGNRCEAGSIGAVVGEMWGDYQVDEPNTLTQAQKDKLINQAKLIAGITAAFAGEDVNVAAGVAAEAVRWNHLSRGILGLGSDEDKEFVEEYIKYCGSGPATSCSTIMQKWKQVSYKKNAGLNDVQIQDWESSVNQIYKHYIGYCKNTDASCNAILRMAKDYYMVSYGGMKEMLIQMELSMYTYLNGGVAAIKNQTIPYIAEGVNGVVNLGKPRTNGGAQVQRATNDAVRKRRESYIRYSPNWSSGSFKASYRKLTPNAKGKVSDDRVKTRYISSDGRYTIIKDNENNYYRIYDNSRGQYLDSNGNIVSTGHLQGKDAKDYVQQKTHIRNLDNE